MSVDPEAAIQRAWRRNARPWISAVREARIESRRQVTDAALLTAIQALRPRRVLDLGCGEGWLCRALARDGVDCLGVDSSPDLIAAAAAAGGEYRCLDYTQLAAQLTPGFDLVVCNFSLLGCASSEAAVRAAATLLGADGHLLIQTLHPAFAVGDQAYVEGWRPGSWQGCGDGFDEPAPWYFRTLAGWFELLAAAGFSVVSLREPAAADEPPASVLLLGRRA